VQGISPPLSRVTVPGDCGGALPKGPASCTLGIQITPLAAQAGKVIQQTLTVNYQSRVPLTRPIGFSVAQNPPPPPNAPVLIAAGQDQTANSPLLTVSTQGGTSRHVVANIMGLPTTDHGFFKVSSCTGSGSSAICTAAGINSCCI
jgi:hypothetical protein